MQQYCDDVIVYSNLKKRMDIFLIILSLILLALGIAGAIFPIIPGVFTSYLGLVAYFFVEGADLSGLVLVLWGIAMIVASLVDNILGPMFTRKYGGSKRAAIGSLVGLLIGSFFIPPLGMVLGSFVGALVGEMSVSNKFGSKEFRVAFGSFLGFIVSTGVKLIYSILILGYVGFKMVSIL